MWVQQGNSWDYKFWEVSLTLDAETNCAALSAALIEADPPLTTSYLEARISTDLAVQGFRICTSASASGLMGHNFQTWTLRGTETMFWNN